MEFDKKHSLNLVEQNIYFLPNYQDFRLYWATENFLEW
jgi:hypothetical protein